MNTPMVIKGRPWREAPAIVIVTLNTGVITGVWVAVPHTGPAPGWAFAYLLVLPCALFGLGYAWDRLVVTADEIRVRANPRIGPWRATVKREQVAQVRAMPEGVIFYDHDRQRLFTATTHLTRSQLADLAGELGVPVWDHRRWHGVGQLKYGVRIRGRTADASQPPGPVKFSPAR
jgi:hypothetical protein